MHSRLWAALSRLRAGGLQYGLRGRSILIDMFAKDGGRRVSSNSLWMMFSSLIRIPFSLLTTVVLANHLPVADLGLFAYGKTVLTAAFPLAMLAHAQLLSPLYVQRKRLSLHLFQHAWLMNSFASLGLWLLLALVFNGRYPGDRQTVFQFMLLSFVFNEWIHLTTTWYQARTQTRQVVRWHLLIFLAWNVWMLAAAYFAWPLDYVVYGFVAQTLATGLSGLLCMYADVGARLWAAQWRPKIFRSLWFKSVPLVCGSLLLFVAQKMDKLVVESVLGLSALGVYAVAGTGVDLLVSLPHLIAGVAAPKLIFVHAKAEHAVRGLQRLTRALVWGMVPLVSFGALLAPIGLPWVLKPHLWPAIEVFVILIPLSVISVFEAGMLQLALHLKNTRFVVVKSGVLALAVGSGTWVAASVFGELKAVAWSMLLVSSLACVVTNLWAQPFREAFIKQCRACMGRPID